MMRAPILFSVLLLGGCISLLPEPPPAPRVFALESGDVAPLVQPGPVDAVIAVGPPAGERAILGTDLVWRTGDELAFVAQTQWSTRAEFALQSMLVETLARQGGFRAATRSGDGRADYEIRWEVLDFQIAQDSMTARFVADIRIVRAPGRRIVAQRIISAEAPVASRSSAVAAQALTRAAREGSARIAAFATEAAAENPPE
ncbi:MAG: membrane integrity-associated transporter subunit PqiC [Hyphomonadaceae bacterium]|nr:membrane integrity-associated transporter subunit PqiC [Hyphomonadaceae bacterium]